VLVLSIVCVAGCRAEAPALTISGSALGREGEILGRQLARFSALHPDLPVALRPTPDAADLRRQLYVQWLNARAPDPDVLQLDVIWTPELAAAGWILPLDRFGPETAEFFPQAIEANRWAGALYAVPWFIDVGMLYWRTDLFEAPPRTLEALRDMAAEAQASGLPYGFVWQGARYEGLVTVFLEHLGAFGGRILDPEGRVVVDAPPAVRALEFMRDAIHRDGVVPAAVLNWQEEPTRFAFQNGGAAFMRNWPYAFALLQDAGESRVANRFGVAPMPGTSGGAPTAALGGAQLAINAASDRPEAAWRLIEFLTAPDQMLERALQAAQLPARRSLYDGRLASVGGMPVAEARRVIDAAVPRPVTPIYSELSEILQIALHRVLTRQAEPAPALREAAAGMRRRLREARLDDAAAPETRP
jgi:multiple sugar transport system substrate-binding protein